MEEENEEAKEKTESLLKVEFIIFEQLFTMNRESKTLSISETTTIQTPNHMELLKEIYC